MFEQQNQQPSFDDPQPSFDNPQPFGNKQPFSTPQPFSNQQPFGNAQPFSTPQPFSNQQPFGNAQPFGTPNAMPQQQPFGEQQPHLAAFNFVGMSREQLIAALEERRRSGVLPLTDQQMQEVVARMESLTQYQGGAAQQQQGFGVNQAGMPQQPYYGDQPAMGFPQQPLYGGQQPVPPVYPQRARRSGRLLLALLILLPLAIAGIGIYFATSAVTSVSKAVSTVETKNFGTANAAGTAGLATANAMNTAGFATVAAVRTANVGTVSAAGTASMSTVAAVSTATSVEITPAAIPTRAVATPAASPAASVARVGQTVHQNGYALTVTGIERADTYQTVFKAKPGHVFVAVNVTIASESDGAASSVPTFATLADSHNTVYPWTIGKDPMLDTRMNMPKGSSASGWITFEVPKDATGLFFTYTPIVSNVKIAVALDK